MDRTGGGTLRACAKPAPTPAARIEPWEGYYLEGIYLVLHILLTNVIFTVLSHCEKYYY